MRILIIVSVAVLLLAASYGVRHWAQLDGAPTVAAPPGEDTPPPAGGYHRIISLSPGLTETLFAVGAGDQVVGVTRFCNWPPEAAARPKVGGFLDPNFEAMVALRPDLVVMDLRLPGKNGHEAAEGIRELDPEAKILMLSAFEGDADIHLALEAGARGYVHKSVTGEELIPAINAVAAGRRWIPQEIASRLRSRNTYEELTAREHEVLLQLSRGMANKEIADTLGISEHTVKTHLKNILGKLRAADRTEAVTTAIQRGIIHL